MRAMQFRAFGDPSVLKLANVADPATDADAALVRVMAASINPSDIKNVAGAMKHTRGNLCHLLSLPCVRAEAPATVRVCEEMAGAYCSPTVLWHLGWRTGSWPCQGIGPAGPLAPGLCHD
jgi:hypothetical protein